MTLKKRVERFALDVEATRELPMMAKAQVAERLFGEAAGILSDMVTVMHDQEARLQRMEGDHAKARTG